MIRFIRDSRDKTIVDIEVFANENGEFQINSKVFIEPYSKFLTENLEDDLQIMRDFSRLQDIGNLYDVGDFNNINELNSELGSILQTVATEYELRYVVD